MTSLKGWAVTALVTFAYGTALTINSLSNASESFFGLILLNSVGRIAGVAAVLVVLGCLHLRGGSLTSERAPLLDWSAGLPFLCAVVACVGYLAYYQLIATGGGLSVWPAAVGLYSVVPILYGVFARRERMSMRSGAGVAMALTAVLLLGFSSRDASGDATQKSSADGGWLVQAILLLCVVLAWGGCDVLSASIVAPRVVILLSTLFGHAMNAAVAGLIVLIQSTDALASAAAPDAPPPIPRAPFGSAQAALILGNAVALVGWLAFVYLGALPDTRLSTFVPVISLYAFFPAVYGLAFLGEKLSPLKAAGLCLGVAATLALAAPNSLPVKAATPSPAAASARDAATEPSTSGAAAAVMAGNGAPPLPPPQRTPILCADEAAMVAATSSLSAQKTTAAVCVSPVGPASAAALSPRRQSPLAGDRWMDSNAWRAAGAVHDSGSRRGDSADA